jgi:Protein of unknown function DUF104
MNQTVSAIYDGEVLKLKSPLAFEIKPNTRVKVTIEEVLGEADQAISFVDVALALNLDSPTDWSSRVDDYLYGDMRDDHFRQAGFKALLLES